MSQRSKIQVRINFRLEERRFKKDPRVFKEYYNNIDTEKQIDTEKEPCDRFSNCFRSIGLQPQKDKKCDQCQHKNEERKCYIQRVHLQIMSQVNRKQILFLLTNNI